MKEKHALWVSAVNSHGAITATTPAKREALHRYNIVALAERFGWTPKEIGEMPVDLLNDVIVICGLRDAKSSTPSKNAR